MTLHSQKTVLIVDDDAMNREVMEAFLSSENFNVLLANNGQRALSLASQEQPGLIILDVRMPDMSGYEVCIQLKAQSHTRRIPVLMITGHGRDSDRQEAYDAGAEAFLSRPFSAAAFMESVHNLI